MLWKCLCVILYVDDKEKFALLNLILHSMSFYFILPKKKQNYDPLNIFR